MKQLILAVLVYATGTAAFAKSGVRNDRRVSCEGATEVIYCAKPNPSGNEFINRAIVCKDGDEYGIQFAGSDGRPSPLVAADVSIRVGATTYSVAEDPEVRLVVSSRPGAGATLYLPMGERAAQVRMDCVRP